jgi:hypothetical protein
VNQINIYLNYNSRTIIVYKNVLESGNRKARGILCAPMT